ncbi:MAG: hypothetical protein LUC17_02785 [Oscillospiraceae bacterium]|nr:hypothetical protein [Oscillospiraceae bacterium]
MAVSKVVYGDETLIDLTEDTVTEDTLAKGVTAHNAAGVAVTGTYEDTIQHVKVNGAEQEIVDNTVDISVPTKVSELDNDVPYATQADLTEVNAAAEQAQSTADSAVSAAANAQSTARAAADAAEAALAEAADLRKLVEDLEKRVAALEGRSISYDADAETLIFS